MPLVLLSRILCSIFVLFLFVLGWCLFTLLVSFDDISLIWTTLYIAFAQLVLLVDPEQPFQGLLNLYQM